MATYVASVRKALADSQQDLIDHREHCSADPAKLAAVGRALGHQVRIKRNNSQYALYTVSEVRQESPDTIVRMGETGRQRLNATNEFNATLDSQVPHPSFSDAEAESNSEFVERLEDDGAHTGLIVIAPHGGDIERFTDQQAERVASRLAAKAVSSWRCKGWKRGGGALDRWHITSTEIHEASFPRLNSVIFRGFTHAVAFHGADAPEILIGGAAPGSLKEEIKTAINAAIAGSGIPVRIASPDEGFGGDSPRNIVNRLTANGANGIQIEQSLAARTNHWQDIADAVANVYNASSDLCTPTPLRSAAHQSMFAHLSGPFAAGAVETPLVIDAAGEARVDWRARLPLLLVSPQERSAPRGSTAPSASPSRAARSSSRWSSASRPTPSRVHQCWSIAPERRRWSATLPRHSTCASMPDPAAMPRDARSLRAPRGRGEPGAPALCDRFGEDAPQAAGQRALRHAPNRRGARRRARPPRCGAGRAPVRCAPHMGRNPAHAHRSCGSARPTPRSAPVSASTGHSCARRAAPSRTHSTDRAPATTRFPVPGRGQASLDHCGARLRAARCRAPGVGSGRRAEDRVPGSLAAGGAARARGRRPGDAAAAERRARRRERPARPSGPDLRLSGQRAHRAPAGPRAGSRGRVPPGIGHHAALACPPDTGG